MTKSKNPVQEIQDYQVFGEYGDVNPSITDASTYTFLNPKTMAELFEHEIEGCFLYSRHWNPSNKYLSDALARLEQTESAQVTSSGMAAIACSIMQICSHGDEIVADRTIYGGTYAFFKNVLPRFGIKVKFVKITDLTQVKNAITDKTKIIYCESMSNPLLSVPPLKKLADLAHDHQAQLVVDNTFAPLVITPSKLGADIVIHSLTKFINGTSDCVGGVICASKKFINQLSDVNSGCSMLFGPVLDSLRAASILKNLHSLHLRMQKHSANAMAVAKAFQKLGLKVHYPGLENHSYHEIIDSLKNEGFGYGGMVVLDVGSKEKADELMEHMQNNKVGYLAVSLGYFKTLFSAPGSSTSSEIPENEQAEIGISPGMVRLSVGLDHDIQVSIERMRESLKECGVIS